ncbi:hypothetical protein [Sulfurimonas sp.]|uniref:hypothetical protein n=1 Tax=Sulfurimonas sp. TaxID=2022749 RepID=UPI0039E502D9
MEEFLGRHHVLSLATSSAEDLSVCSLFYSYIKEETSFIVASSDDTTHIKHTKKNNSVAGNILLETKTVGKIQGVQFSGSIILLEEKSLANHYFKDFPYALALNPKLWQIKVTSFKMTDNRLGFGKKLIWP